MPHFGRAAALIALSGTLLACGQKSRPDPTTAADGADAAARDVPALEGASGPTLARQNPRRVGDVWVHRFSGSYRSSDLILREEVLSQKGDTLVVDFVLSEGQSETHLRTLMALPSERILAVSRVTAAGDEQSATIADFEKMLERTTFVPDQNAGRIATSSKTCLVGKQELDCDLAEYKVYLDQKEATLTIARSEEMHRDLSGEIVAVDGTVLYHAELIEMQRGPEIPQASSGVAMTTVDLEERD